MDIAPVGSNAPDLTPEAKRFLVRLTQIGNTFLDDMAHNMAPGQDNPFFTIHETKETAGHLVHKAASAVCDATKALPNIHLVFFPAGAIPLAKLIRGMGYPDTHMHALDISGSIGTESENASIKGSIPDQLLNPDNNIVIPEDIIDTVNTIMTFIQARGEFRDASETHKNWLRTLGERLKTAHANSNNDPEAYADFARTAAAEHVSVLSVWSKNGQARNALLNQACCVSPAENPIQAELFKRYPMTPLSPTLWTLGGDYTLDTGILWSRVARMISTDLQRDPRVKRYIGPDGEWLLRAVRIGPLAYFKTEGQETNVVRYIAKLATQMLTH